MDRISDDNANAFLAYFDFLASFEQQLIEAAGMNASNKGLNDLSQAALNALKLRMTAMGIPDESQKQGRERLAIEREKLKLQQETNAAANGTGEMDNWVIHMEDDDGDS